MSGASSLSDVGVLIAAGGRGERAGPGGPKQLRPIGGAPMLLRAVRPFAQHPRVRQIVIALPPEVIHDPPNWLRELVGDRLCLVPGGETRQASVASALAVLHPDCRIVLVHDAARPFVTNAEIDPVIAAAETGNAALVAIPISDTLKRTDDGRTVTATVSREGLWRAQTPQGFPRELFEKAHERVADATLTDDAALVEAVGGTVVLVHGRSANIKVTTPEDFRLAEALVST